MSSGFPLPSNMQVQYGDQAVTSQNPGFAYGDTTASSLWCEDRSIGGAMYRVQNATWSKFAQKWSLVNPALPAYGTVLLPNGTTQFIMSPVGISPFTVWSVQASVSALNGAATFGALSGNFSGNFNPSTFILPTKTDLSGIGIFNVKAPQYGAKGDGVTDDTAAIVAANAALIAAGGGTLYFPAGTYVCDTTQNVGNTNKLLLAIALPSNSTLMGAGRLATTIILKAATARKNTVASAMVANNNPDGGNVGVNIRDITIDGNRTNQGPEVFSYSNQTGGSAYTDGIDLWTSDQVSITDVTVQNTAGFGVFAENGVTHAFVDNLYSFNTLSGLAFDAVHHAIIGKIVCKNSDPAALNATTSTTSITGGSSQTATVGSIGSIVVGTVLDINTGHADYEQVKVTAVAGSTYTAYFKNNHSGTWGVQNASFASDSAVQINVGADHINVAAIEVDYSGALNKRGPALELVGCRYVSVGSVVALGTYQGIWIHNWTISATNYILHDVSIGSATIHNWDTSSSGSTFPGAVEIDANALVGGTNTLRNVNIGSLSAVTNVDGFTAPATAQGLEVVGNCSAITVQASIDGPSTGVGLNTCDSVQVIGSVRNCTTPVSLTGATNCKVQMRGYNPIGKMASPPAVPASGTASVNNNGADASVILTTGAGVTISAIAIGGLTTGLSQGASAMSYPLPVPAGSSITLTYAGGTPSWVWFLE